MTSTSVRSCSSSTNGKAKLGAKDSRQGKKPRQTNPICADVNDRSILNVHPVEALHTTADALRRTLTTMNHSKQPCKVLNPETQRPCRLQHRHEPPHKWWTSAGRKPSEAWECPKCGMHVPLRIKFSASPYIWECTNKRCKHWVKPR